MGSVILIFPEMEIAAADVLDYDTFLLYARSENSSDRFLSFSVIISFYQTPGIFF